MTVLEWARSVKPDLLRLQQERGIPALWSAAQMAHESASGDGLSELARKANNYAGLKWAEWERSYGCTPVTYGTWEVLDGQRVDLAAAFCSCPSWEIWLKVYGDLLTGTFYGPALKYAGDPLLFGSAIWRAGWATDPNYLVGTSKWMAALYADYQDTLPAVIGQAPVAAAREPVAIRDANGRELCTGWIQDNRTVVLARDLIEGLGLALQWHDEGPAITVRSSTNLA